MKKFRELKPKDVLKIYRKPNNEFLEYLEYKETVEFKNAPKSIIRALSRKTLTTFEFKVDLDKSEVELDKYIIKIGE